MFDSLQTAGSNLRRDWKRNAHRHAFSSCFSRTLNSEELFFSEANLSTLLEAVRVREGRFSKKDIPKKKILRKEPGSEMPGKHKIRLERGPIVATDSCTEFRRYVIVIWKEGRPVVEKEEKEGKDISDIKL